MFELLLLQQALGIPELHLVGVDVKEKTIDIHAEMLTSKAVCPTCSRVCGKAHQYLWRTFRHLPWWGKATSITVRHRQFACEERNKTFAVPLAFLLGEEHHVSRIYADVLFDRVKGCSIKVVAQQEGLPEKTVEGIYFAVAREREQKVKLEPTTMIGIDEVAIHKGHGKLKAVIYDLKRGKILKMLENRDRTTLEAWFRGQPEWWLKAIRYVAIDLWMPYRKLIRDIFGDSVTLVADKFHVVKVLGERLTKCRRGIQREAPKEVKDKLKGIRWAILKQPKKLTSKEKVALREALRHSKELAQMYELKLDFAKLFWPQPGAVRRLRKWMNRVQATSLKRLHSFVKTLKLWWPEIVGYLRSGKTNAGAEGINTTIKLVNRRGYGFRNLDRFELRVKHETGALST